MEYKSILLLSILISSAGKGLSGPSDSTKKQGNPAITHKYTADPAAIVYNGMVYMYVGHDEADENRNFYYMKEWLIFSSSDMVNWKEHSSFSVNEFSWALGDAWATHVVQRNNKFYLYVTVTHKSIEGKAIGVAVSDSPTGPFKDARETALITNDMTTDISISWDDIDPAVFIDDDGQAYIFWGNTKLHYAKLKENMIELDGPIQTIDLPRYTEAPWVHKRKGWYYLSYAYDFPEKTAYAMSRSLQGPWKFKGILNEVSGNCNTNHHAIIDYKGKSYFIYHNGSIPTHGGSFRRSVCIDYLYYNKEGTMKRVIMTSEGVSSSH